MKMLFHIIDKTDNCKLFTVYTVYMLFELKFGGKMFKETYAGSLSTKAKQVVLDIYNYLLKDVKSTGIHIGHNDGKNYKTGNSLQ